MDVVGPYVCSAVVAALVVLLVLPMLVHVSRVAVGYVVRPNVAANGSFAHPSTLPLPTGLPFYAWLFAMLAATLVLGLGVLAVAHGGRREGFLHRLAGPFASVAGYGILLVPLVGSASYGASYGFRLRSLAFVGGVGAVLLFFGFWVHNARYSLHPFYRERLSAGFVLKRQTTIGDHGHGFAAVPVDYDIPIGFTETVTLARARVPELPEPIICAAANFSDRTVPRGQGCESFVFDRTHCGSTGLGTHETKLIEDQLRGSYTPLTLPTLMAVSGAAISPAMGRYTRRSVQLLMAMLNLRLGIWIPNPERRVAAEETRRREKWQERLATTRFERLTKVARRLASGWYEPGAWYVLREGLGLLRRGSRFVHLSDGGHWENLGLVELLRRGCTDIISIDGSLDPPGRRSTLGRAIALARMELGLELREVEGHEHGVVTEFTVLDRTGTRVGRVLHAPAEVGDDASLDLREYAAKDRSFPRHSTLKQVFTDEVFEAYRTLGRQVGGKACDAFDDVALPHGATDSGSYGRARPVVAASGA